MEDGKWVEGSIWFYAPNKGAPVFFAVAFAASGLLHLWQSLHYKSWKLTGLYVFTSTIFAAGFIMREIGAFNYESIEIYIASIVLVFVSPPLYELANYYILGRILYYCPYYSPIHPGRVLTTFTGLSILVEALNANGAVNTANTTLPASTQATGRALLKAALVLQLAIIVTFAGLAVTFHVRCRRAGVRNAGLYGALATLYGSTALLLVRTVFRTAEYFTIAQLNAGGVADPNALSPLVRYEWFFYVFEAGLMLGNTVLLNARHPRRYLPETNRTYLARDGVTEVDTRAPGRERPWYVKVADPFDLVGLAMGKDKETKFWEIDEREAASAGAGAGEGGGLALVLKPSGYGSSTRGEVV
ncbi:uncharacterized protein E0L32_009184 [Thyridium curvatum]|uniref:Uncharacterized protein n=1 Tax=Thyridium curvatum TaxID=1093900 RepID=A0A507AP97_9PEZI|nr:uncharacterized protein E0L32_009184 [Thyridium curvatum]TPX09583.1 hypothetical protein E0L32_009184 [Thyridium curvatum]